MLAAFGALVGASAASGAGRVELLVVTGDRAPLTAQQDWMRRLSQAGIVNVQIRRGTATDQVGVKVQGTAERPVYAVTASLNARGELELPGARFAPGQEGRLAEYLNRLAEQGLPKKPTEEVSAFGLTRDQFESLHKSLAQPVTFSTKGLSRREVMYKLHPLLRSKIEVAPSLVEQLGQDQVSEELSGLSLGTVMACVLRPPGMCLVPRRTSSGGVALTIVRATPDREIWPIGWDPEGSPRRYVPKYFEELNVRLQDVTVAQVIEAIGGRLGTPMLVDHNAMARWGVKIDEVRVNLAPERESYERILKKALYQVDLKPELRIDEAGKAFFWITTKKPI